MMWKVIDVKHAVLMKSSKEYPEQLCLDCLFDMQFYPVEQVTQIVFPGNRRVDDAVAQSAGDV